MLGICQIRAHLALAPGCHDVLETSLLQEHGAFVLKASMFIVMVTAPSFKLCSPCDTGNKGSSISFWLSKPDLGDREARAWNASYLRVAGARGPGVVFLLRQSLYILLNPPLPPRDAQPTLTNPATEPTCPRVQSRVWPHGVYPPTGSHVRF